ncbi:hypothetical protein KSS87_018631, partial [Heliosperma pusillum]
VLPWHLFYNFNSNYIFNFSFSNLWSILRKVVKNIPLYTHRK